MGWIAAAPVSSCCVHAGVIELSVYVGEHARGQGIGLMLLQTLIASSENAGIWTLQSQVFPENAAPSQCTAVPDSASSACGRATADTTASGATSSSSSGAARTSPDQPTTQEKRHVTLTTPTVLFVCVSNAGKSVMAQGLMQHAAPDQITAISVGTNAKTSVNAQSAQVLAELGIDVSTTGPHNSPTPRCEPSTSLSSSALKPASNPSPGHPWKSGTPTNPRLRGIEGLERMRLVRDDIADRVNDLAARLTHQDPTTTPE